MTSDSDGDGDSDSDEDSSEDDEASDAMDASSLSFRDGASGGMLARSRRRRAEKKAEKKKMKDTQKRLAKRGGRGRRGGGQGSNASSSEEDEESRRMSRKMADTYITESMSVTPGSSVACGSLMGRSLGNAMSSSFADDGLVWGAAAAAAGGMAGTPDDAFFHENVSPSVSPPLAAPSAIGVAGRSRPLDIGVRSKRALF